MRQMAIAISTLACIIAAPICDAAPEKEREAPNASEEVLEKNGKVVGVEYVQADPLGGSVQQTPAERDGESGRILPTWETNDPNTGTIDTTPSDARDELE